MTLKKSAYTLHQYQIPTSLSTYTSRLRSKHLCLQPHIDTRLPMHWSWFILLRWRTLFEADLNKTPSADFHLCICKHVLSLRDSYPRATTTQLISIYLSGTGIRRAEICAYEILLLIEYLSIHVLYIRYSPVVNKQENHIIKSVPIYFLTHISLYI